MWPLLKPSLKDGVRLGKQESTDIYKLNIKKENAIWVTKDMTLVIR